MDDPAPGLLEDFAHCIGPDGKVRGRFRATGIRPKCAERLVSAGVHLPADLFEHVKVIQ